MVQGREGKSRYINKRETVIELEEFEALLESLETLLLKSVAVLMYYTGMRSAEVVGDTLRRWKVLAPHGIQLIKEGKLKDKVDEILKDSKKKRSWMNTPMNESLWRWKLRAPLPGILKENITLSRDGMLHITSIPLKHGKRVGTVDIDTKLKHVDFIIQQWNLTQPKQRIWPMLEHDLWLAISEASDRKIYPHAFRMSRATFFAYDPTVALGDIKNFFGWRRVSTADSYIAPIRSSIVLSKSMLKEQQLSEKKLGE